MTSPELATRHATGRAPQLWSIPTSVWAYGLLRPVAFAAPMWSAGGGIGLGLLPAIVLYVFLLRRSEWAWHGLVVLDTVSLVFVAAASATSDDVALAVPGFAALALLCLLLPSTRRFVHESAERI